MKSARKTTIPLLAPKPARRPRWVKVMVIGLVLYTLLGFLVLPAVVKWQLRKQLPALTHRMAKVEQVRMNPFVLSLTVRGLALTETNGTAFAAFDELYVNFQLSSIFHRAWTFGEIRLTHPTANLARFADGSFNFANLASTNTPPPTNPPAAPPSVLIQSLLVTNAVVTVTDHTTPQTFHTAYGPIQVALTDFNTHREKEEPYSFVATTSDGETFTWAGRFSLNQLRSQGQFKLTGIPPAKYAPYLAMFTTVQVQRGALDVGASYRINVARVPAELEVTNAIVELRDLLVKPPGSDATLLAIERFKVANTSASLTGQVARVGLVELNGGSVFIGRETNGQPTVLNYLLPQTNKTVAAETSGTNGVAVVPWHFELAELVVTNFNVALGDHSTAGVAELGLDGLSLNLKGLSNQSNAPIDLAFAFNWRGGGALQLESRGTLLPPDLTTLLTISNLAIAPVQPYLGQHLNLVVHSGGLNVQGTAKFNPAATPQIQFKGDVGVTNFSSSDTVAYHELAAWENHQVRGIDFTLHPSRLTIEEIKFIGARNNLVVSSNGQVNVAALAKLPPPATNDSTVVSTTNAVPHEPFPIRVGLITLERNSFRVADDSLLRRFEMNVQEINGSISNIVLPGLDRATVDIRGKVSALAPFEIVGTVTPDPKNLFVDLKVAFTNTDLTPLSPYTEKFVGRPLTKGKLTDTELRYHIENKDIQAANIVGLDHLTLGGRVESPDATKLPVKLAIGLLKDMEGRIALDLPITGRTDDPQFSVWGLVGQTFKNLILKVATSPFSLFGALAGGGEELQFVDFAPGAAILDAGQTNKLMKLAEALRKRPALEMEINATYDAVMDVDALGRRKVAERMKALRIEELVARGKPTPALSELVLEDGEYERLLRKAYQAAFQTTPERALREALAATLATNAPGESVSVPVANTGGQRKGAEMLADRSKSLAQLAAAARTSGGGTNPTASAPPKTERELIRDELEQRLATTAPVTSDELRSLMPQRIEVVQKFLADSAGIAAERLLSSAPNPEDVNRKGAARAVFSLE